MTDSKNSTFCSQVLNGEPSLATSHLILFCKYTISFSNTVYNIDFFVFLQDIICLTSRHYTQI